MPRFRLSRSAQADLAHILETSSERWGDEARHARRDAHDDRVRQPVHVIFYRARPAGVIEIVRIFHERMDPRRHVDLRMPR